MLRYDLRFWDKDNKVMLTGVGISPNQLPIAMGSDGKLAELRGNFVPMLCTYQKAINGYIWEGDIIECGVPYDLGADMPTSLLKVRGVMQFNERMGSFTINIASTPETEGRTFQVKNAKIIGCAVSHPELLQISQNQNENKKTSADKI